MLLVFHNFKNLHHETKPNQTKPIRFKFFLIFLLIFNLHSIFAQTPPTGSITGPSTVDIFTSNLFTCNVTPLGFTIVSYTWWTSSQGVFGSINGQTGITNIVDVTSNTSDNANYLWDDFFAPQDVQIVCDITYTDGSNTSSFAIYSNYIHVKGIPASVSLSGPPAIHECCTNAVVYSVQNYIDGDVFTWSYPPGWSVISGLGTSSLTVLPDFSNGGTVNCDIRISTSPTFYVRSVTKQISRPYPVVNHITATTIPCVGSQVTFYCDNPCGARNFSWNLPPDWDLVGQENNFVTVIAGTSGNVSVTVNFDGGCTVLYTAWIAVIADPPHDPSFDNDCHPSIDPNGCAPGPKRICGLNGGTINVDFDPEVFQYNCSVSFPWLLREGFQTGSSLTVMAANINDVEIYLPNYNTINANIHRGTYRIQALNCQGSSQFSSYDFRREADWWCDCPQFNPCVCPPQFKDPKDKCNNAPLKLSANQETTVSIYPNPTNGNFTLELGTEKKEIWITNIVGKVIYHQTTAANQLIVDLSSEANGLYFISIVSPFQTSNQKILLQK